MTDLTQDYDPSEFDDMDLQQVFVDVDRDLVPERYQLICQEMDRRGLTYQDLPQAERELLRLEDENTVIDDIEGAAGFFINLYRLLCG